MAQANEFADDIEMAAIVNTEYWHMKQLDDIGYCSNKKGMEFNHTKCKFMQVMV